MEEEPPYLTEPECSGRWFAAPIFAFSGVFLLDGVSLTSERIRCHIDHLYRAVLTHRTKKWPRLFTQFFLVPVYCSPEFTQRSHNELLPSTQGGRCSTTRSRVGIIVKPMLYNSSEHKMVFREAIQNWNMNYYPILKPLYEQGEDMAEKHYLAKKDIA